MEVRIPDSESFASLVASFTPNEVTVLRASTKHTVYRLTGTERSYILKWFHDPAQCIEPAIYSLLERYGAPTLPIYKNTGRAIVIEDLRASPAWRLAGVGDMKLAATGEALATWYQRLHRAGRQALNDPNRLNPGLQPWVLTITQQALTKAGMVFKLEGVSTWKAACAMAPRWIVKYCSLPQTFNYNDFATENLALSRQEDQPLQAIVFDYDCFSTGITTSDWRNVISALEADARAAFQAGFGPVSPEEKYLDRSLAVLYGLVVASQRERIPAWADPLVKSVLAGELTEA